MADIVTRRPFPRTVLEVYCHKDPDQILIRPSFENHGSGGVRVRQTAPERRVTFTGADGQRVTIYQPRCAAAGCQVRPRWREVDVNGILAQLPEGTWRVSDDALNRIIGQSWPTAAAYIVALQSLH